MSTRSIVARVKYDELNVTNYYANTYDVIAGEGEEEDYSLVVVASFKHRGDAQSFVNNNDTRDIIGIRPPGTVMQDAIAWLATVNSAYAEGVTLKR